MQALRKPRTLRTPFADFGGQIDFSQTILSQIEFSQTILEDIGEKIKQILVDGAGKWVKSEENDIFLGDAMHIWRFAWQTIFPKSCSQTI